MNHAATRRIVESLIQRELRAAFHAIHLCGSVPADTGRPLVVFGNHNSFHDGYALWYLASRVLGRPTSVWMQEWSRFPFFAAAGALPFPADNPADRAATIRRTRARFDSDRASALIYFPEGRMHPAEEGLNPWPETILPRIGRLLGEPDWLPVAIHSSWRSADRPELFLIPGDSGPANSHALYDRLADLVARAPERSLQDSSVILEGRRSSNVAGYGWLSGFFRKRL